MPPRIEIPEIVSMADPEVEQARDEAQRLCKEGQERVAEAEEAVEQLSALVEEGLADPTELAQAGQQLREAVSQKQLCIRQAQELRAWADERDLLGSYLRMMGTLEELARQRNNAARMAKGTVPRWFATLPCELPFTVFQTERGEWGEKLGQRLLLETPVLTQEHRYPLEKRLVEIVAHERSEGRRVMVYFEQNDVRSMARRLELVLQEMHPWTLPNSVDAEDRQQAILSAVESGRRVVIVPYRRVNEGLNLQQAVDTVIWYEMAMNLFLLDQASRRAWRLGKREEVRIYFLAYAGSAGHSKLRKLGGQSGAAAAFAGEPAKGALVEHAGANKTMLARLSAQLETEDEENVLSLLDGADGEQLKAAFARRNAEEREVLLQGRQWFGVTDTLPERLASFSGESHPSVWEMPVISPAAIRTATAQKPSGVKLPAYSAQSAVDTHVGAAVDKTDMEPSVSALDHTASQSSPSVSIPPIRLVFGSVEHIRLGKQRNRKGKARAAHPSPVEVQHIPAMVVTPVASQHAVSLSLWDLLEEDSSCLSAAPAHARPAR